MYEAPFVYFGNKKTIAAEVWKKFGAAKMYIEPFMGTGSVFFSCPHQLDSAILNDSDGLVTNFWRAVKYNPEGVAEHCDMLRDEIECHARFLYTMRHSGADFTTRLVESVYYCDAKLAGWWAGYNSAMIMPQCGIPGVWYIDDEGRLSRAARPYVGGVYFQKPNVQGKACIRWVRQGTVLERLITLKNKLDVACILCGDWHRTMIDHILDMPDVAIFLDPPYDSSVNKVKETYKQSIPVTSGVYDWCLEQTTLRPHLRIAVCGYAGEQYEALTDHGWNAHRWATHGGLGKTARSEQTEEADWHTKRMKETIWFSPACLPDAQQTNLF